MKEEVAGREEASVTTKVNVAPISKREKEGEIPSQITRRLGRLQNKAISLKYNWNFHCIWTRITLSLARFESWTPGWAD